MSQVAQLPTPIGAKVHEADALMRRCRLGSPHIVFGKLCGLPHPVARVRRPLPLLPAKTPAGGSGGARIPRRSCSESLAGDRGIRRAAVLLSALLSSYAMCLWSCWVALPRLSGRRVGG